MVVIRPIMLSLFAVDTREDLQRTEGKARSSAFNINSMPLKPEYGVVNIAEVGRIASACVARNTVRRGILT